MLFEERELNGTQTLERSQAFAPGSPELRALWEEPACRAYVDTASYGLPPKATVAAVEQALAAWQMGRADWVSDWDAPAEEARSLAGVILGCPTAAVGLLPP